MQKCDILFSRETSRYVHNIWLRNYTTPRFISEKVCQLFDFILVRILFPLF